MAPLVCGHPVQRTPAVVEVHLHMTSVFPWVCVWFLDKISYLSAPLRVRAATLQEQH